MICGLKKIKILFFLSSLLSFPLWGEGEGPLKMRDLQISPQAGLEMRTLKNSPNVGRSPSSLQTTNEKKKFFATVGMLCQDRYGRIYDAKQSLQFEQCLNTAPFNTHPSLFYQGGGKFLQLELTFQR